MNNENQQQRRPGAKTSQSKKGAATQTGGGIRRGTRPATGRKGHTQGQDALRPGGTAADGFLKHQFLPLYEPGRCLPAGGEVEKELFSSLSVLSGCYGLNLIDVADKPYPHNILLAYWDAEKQFSLREKDTELFIVRDDKGRAGMATRQTAHRTYSLYYIPVLPLYRLIGSGEHPQGAELLLSVFSYLCLVVDIPWYRDEQTYLYDHYQMVKDWTETDKDSTDEADYNFYMAAHQSAETGGDAIHREIANGCHLGQFAQRIAEAKPCTPFDEACLHVAKTAFGLWSAFPQANIYRHLPELVADGDDEDDDEYDNTIHVGEYIHFIAESEGTLYDEIQYNINAELNEKMYWQEHSLISVYNDDYLHLNDSLDFEERLFALFDELCYILNDLP